MRPVRFEERPPWRRLVQAAVGGVGTLALVAGAVVVFGRVGQGSEGGTPAAQATAVASATPAAVVNVQSGNITIEDAVVKTTGNAVASLYFNVKNAGPADTLIDETTDASNATELFDTQTNGNVTTMPLLKSLAIPANSTVAVQPGGYHVMINDIGGGGLEKGSKVQVTLTFEHAGVVKFEAPVSGY